MSPLPTAIPKQPALPPAEDYYRLRREGIGFIEQLGSQQWTDYNLHDPGITILEALCYALTDLAYRIGWDVKDLLTPATPSSDPEQPFPHQAFFTARRILTVNPTTPADFRRLLIDLDGVRNAWLTCPPCACDLHYYAWCEENQLRLAYQPPTNQSLAPRQVAPQGLYEVLLELEADPELGDLNDRKTEHTYSLFDHEGQAHRVTLELRFPAGELIPSAAWQLFLAGDEAFAPQDGVAPTLSADLYSSKADEVPVTDDAVLRRHWRDVFYVRFTLALHPGGELLVLDNVALRLFGDATAKTLATTTELASQLATTAATGPLPRYRRKLLRTAQAVAEARAALHAHRNLAEDYCHLAAVAVEDVAVCADVEVTPDADIERVQAQLWLALADYFSPAVRFHTLPELLDAGQPVEEIFNGPALRNGFLKPDELAATDLKTTLRTSDIINRLMAIEGIVAVNNLLLSKYDAEGQPVAGAADPTRSNGQLVFDPAKTSAAWLLAISPRHQPRLYYQLSRFLFYKNGLPFLPRLDEAYDTLTQLQGEAEQPKIRNALADLPVPAGTFRQPTAYFPVQYSFPQAYGIGPAGLPDSAPPLRRAQAKQLKAYLLVFEQLLGNALAQVAHVADLFSLDPAVAQTYFTQEFSEALLAGYAELVANLDAAGLAALAESKAEFLKRRNQFLDHLLARFGEQFTEYALLLTTLQGEQTGLAHLVDAKINFLQAYPSQSHDRGQAFDYTTSPYAPGNDAGLKRRVNSLLGYPDLTFDWTLPDPAPGPYTGIRYVLREPGSAPWLAGEVAIDAASVAAAQQKYYHLLISNLMRPEAYIIEPEESQFRLRVQMPDGSALGQHPALLPTKTAAQALQEKLLSWSSHDRALVVEHLLLRPKFVGDALYPACSDGACETCGAEDPYSFRLTVVMPGWTAPFAENLELRQFADRTVRQEMPAHLLGKVCWVGNDGFVENPCDPVVDQLADLLAARQVTDAGKRPTAAEACACAQAIYAAFGAAFRAWYADKVLYYALPAALMAQLAQIFDAEVPPASIACAGTIATDLWADIKKLLVAHFAHIARYGWQFERFEAAWCAWLTANAAFDWPAERLPERVAAILRANLTAAPATAATEETLCQRATAILTAYGTTFHDWLAANFEAGRPWENFSAFVPAPIVLGPGLSFRAGTVAALKALLKPRYDAYREVSYRLWVVVHLLSELRNVYPGATLHDCDDGSDQNPVRLGSTVLGNYPLRRALPPESATPPDPAPPAPAP